MRRLWECKDWSVYTECRGKKGISEYFDSKVNEEVKETCEKYIAWLRIKYDFPIRVLIYFKEKRYVVTARGEKFSAVFEKPCATSKEPYIQVAVGDYWELVKEYGDKRNALEEILYLITCELSLYFQWIKGMHLNGCVSKKNKRQASYYAQKIILDYEETIENTKHVRRLWECKDWSKYIDINRRNGIRQRYDSEVDKEVRRACKEYIAWLRTQYDFPVRVPIYFKNQEYIVTSKGEIVSAFFFGPYDKAEEPYIKVAVGDYSKLLRKYKDKDDALAEILYSITHELSHYFQWIKDVYMDDSKSEKIERQAIYYAREIVLDYAEIRDHP